MLPKGFLENVAIDGIGHFIHALGRCMIMGMRQYICLDMTFM